MSMWPVLVHLDCYHRMPQTGYLINNPYLLCTVLEARRSNIKRPADKWLGKVLFLVHRQDLFPHPRVVERLRGSLLGVFYKGTDTTHEGSTLMTSLPKTHLLRPSPWKIGNQHINFEGDMNIQTIAWPLHTSSPHCTLLVPIRRCL